MVGISQKLTFKIRKEVIDKVNKLPLKYFDSVSTGDTMSKITNDADSIGENLNQSFSIISSSLMLLVGLFIAMFVTA
jgi:ATP-binding cassette subfamily B protein